MKLSLLAATALGCINALPVEEAKRLQQDFIYLKGPSPFAIFEPENFPFHTLDLFLEAERHDLAIQEGRLRISQFGGRNPVEALADIISTKNLHHLVTEEDVAVSGPIMCSNYGSYMIQMGPKLGLMTDACFKYVLAGCADLQQMRHVSPSYVERNVLFFTGNIQALDFFSLEQIKIITNYPTACEDIEGQSLGRLTTAEQWKAVQPSCLYSIKDLHKVNISTHLTNGIIPYDQFAYMKTSFDNNSTAALTEKHVRYYQSNVVNVSIPLPIHHLNPDACKGVSPSMFKKWADWMGSQKRNIELKPDSWKNFPKNVLREYASKGDTSELLKLIHCSNFQSLTAEQLKQFFQYPEACRFIHHRAVFSKEEFKKAKISSACYHQMHYQLKHHILTNNYSLPDNILEHETCHSVKKVTGGILTLSKIKNRNKRKIIKNASTKVKNGKNHVCRLITDLGIFKSVRIFRNVVPDKCWENLGFKIQSRHVLRAPKLLAGRPKVLKIILQKEPNGFLLARLSPRTIKRLTSGKAAKECKYLRHDQFKLFGEEVCKALSPQCVASLSFLKKLRSEEITLFGPKAFSHLDNHSAQGFNFGNLLNDQLENISNEVDFERTIGKLLSNDVLENQITPKRLNFLPARVWGAVPADAFCIFRSSDIFARISGEKMVFWTAEQVRMIPSEVLSGMNPNQAKRIGHLIGNTKKKEIAVLLEGHSKNMDPLVKSVFSERFAIFAMNFTSEAPSFSKSILSSALSVIIAAVVLL